LHRTEEALAIASTIPWRRKVLITLDILGLVLSYCIFDAALIFFCDARVAALAQLRDSSASCLCTIPCLASEWNIYTAAAAALLLCNVLFRTSYGIATSPMRASAVDFSSPLRRASVQVRVRFVFATRVFSEQTTCNSYASGSIP
jgi:hypothetical protein